MGFYDFQAIEKKWQQYWEENKTFQAEENSSKPKYYVMDMFPYPSGAGLHVGHPLGYIATDIVARFKKLQGYNVLHPMGFDAFGLPAEQYAIETGTHPAVTTAKNVARFKEQLRTLGLAYDSRTSFRTCDPEYYKWTQWIFLKLFGSWYNKDSDKAEALDSLIQKFEDSGNDGVNAACADDRSFSASEWKGFSEKERQEVLMDYRLMFISEAMVNWCPELGTVLANDEVINGKSERGGYDVIRQPMRQWSMRMTAYADRLLEGLNRIDWPSPIKEMQRNWIGRSEGAAFTFEIEGSNEKIEVFSTRPDTIFGCTFMVLAPEHELVDQITTKDQEEAITAYKAYVDKRSELERMADAANITGEFTGAYAIHPFSGKKIPIWIADYVLAGYGTGAIMAVPAHDTRDYAFAKHFGLDIVEVVSGGNIEEEAFAGKEGTLVNSDFLDGLDVKEAITTAIKRLEENWNWNCEGKLQTP